MIRGVSAQRMKHSIVTTVEEWLLLSEVSLPTLNSPNEKGSTYNLLRVGFLAVPKAALPAQLAAAQAAGDKRLLPTAVIKFDGKEELCRLSLDLSPWVLWCVEVAHAGNNPFPSEVEFGRLNGRAYAEFVL